MLMVILVLMLMYASAMLWAEIYIKEITRFGHLLFIVFSVIVLIIYRLVEMYT